LLLELAPHLIQPISINIPYMNHHRPWLLIRIGLFFYNNLARRPSYKKAHSVHFGKSSLLVKELTRGFSFSDGQVDDSRLVILNAVQAARNNADIFIRQKCTAIEAENKSWKITLQDQVNGGEQQLISRTIVNATGPWVSQFVENIADTKPANNVRLVKGSHLIVPRMQPKDQAFLLQNEDGRVVFVIPYRHDFSLIGTTEEEFNGDPFDAIISNQETEYLIDVVNNYFCNPIKKDDIVHSYSGIRPLVSEMQQSATKASRDYRLEFENTSLPLLSVYGGKVTTYRILAEQAVDKMGKYISNLNRSNSREQKLPGGDIESLGKLIESIQSEYPWLPMALVRRLASAYGSISFEILAGAKVQDDLGVDFGHGLSQREVDYLIHAEWAITVDDILWRRTKLGLVFDESQTAVLNQHLKNDLT
jgi:glycerol-3-phosphate dehydrogenase